MNLGAFSDLQAFKQMGGYATTVWPAYSIVWIVLLGQWCIARRKFRRLRKLLYRKYANPS